jgi:transposase
MEVVYPCAHALLVIAFHMLKPKENYRELGADHFDRIDVNRMRRSLVRRLERLGHRVTLEPLAQTASEIFIGVARLRAN